MPSPRRSSARRRRSAPRRQGSGSSQRPLPAHLVPCTPGPPTLGRFVGSSLNPDHPTLSPELAGDLEPRQIQYEAAEAIAERATAGGRQVLLADEPGVGTTISAVLGASAVGDLRAARRALVVAGGLTPTCGHADPSICWASEVMNHGQELLLRRESSAGG